MLKIITLPTTTGDIGEMMYSQLLKSYLRSSMSQKRLNHLMLLHIHKSITDKLDMIEVANNFIYSHEHRKNFFGTEFRQFDMN